MPIIFLISLLFFVVLNNNIYSLLTGFLCIYLFTVFYAIRYSGIISLYSLFLYTSTFFLYDAFWFTLFDENKNFLKQTFPKRYFIDDEIGIKFLICSILLTYIMHISYFLAYKKRKSFTPIVKHDLAFEKAGILIMLIFLFPSLVKLYIQLMYIKKFGYLALFAGDLSDIKYPIWTTGANLIFITGFSIFVAANPSKKKFIIYSIIFFLLMAFNGAKGQRGILIAPLVALLYWFTQKYNVKIKIGTLILIFVLIVGITYSLGTIRNSYGEKNKTNTTNINVIDLISNVLYTQTTSRAVPMIIIEGELPYHNYPFIFSPLLTYLTRFIYPSKGQDEVSLQKYNDISSITLFSVSPSAYYKGKGYGGAFLAEAYDCGGYIGIVFWGIILSVFIAFCDYSKLNINNNYLPFLFLFLLNFAMLPRNRLFTLFDTHLPKLFILVIILPLIKEKKLWRLR